MPDPAALPEPEPEAAVRPLPVLAEARPIERVRRAPLPAAAVAATGGFLLGVASFLLVRVIRRPGPRPRSRSTRRLGGRGQRVNVAATRSFLVDVHLLRDR